MSEPRRFLTDPSATSFERDLLESYSAEQPSSAARARALAIAGVTAGTIAAAAGTTAVGASAGAAGVAAPKAVVAGVSAFVKLGVIASMVVAAATVGVIVQRSTPATRGTDAVPTATATAATATAASKATPTTAAATSTSTSTPAIEPPPLSPADLPTAAAVPVAPSDPAAALHPSPHLASASASAPGARTDTDASLSEEIASFDRARAALDAGQADRALALVDAYESRFPSGTFVQEAEVLRVKALVRKGDRAGANRIGQRFLAAHPTSPHAARVRAILEPSSP